MYRSRTVVRIPSGLAVGQLIGKQGSNIKHLQTRSCARMAVDTASETVTISGNVADVELAQKLLEAQFASWRSSAASAYPHPTEVKYVLKDVQSSSTSLIFLPVSSDVVTQATDRPERLYRLQHKPTMNKLDSATENLSSSALLEGFASLSVNKESQFSVSNGASIAVDGMVEAVRQAVRATSKLAELKVTFNLGTQFFYAGRYMQAPDQLTNISINKMNGMELGGREATLKSVYSNGVKPSQFNLVKQHAISKLKFTRVASKATASVHIKNKDLNTSLVIAFIRSGEKLSLRKIKSGAVKPFFLSFMHDPPSQDVRLKLTGQNQFAKGGPEIKSLAGIIAGSTMQSGRLNIPCSRSQEVDKARIKTKEVYEGTWKGRVLRITFSTVRGESNQEHCEVTGRMPSLNNTLQAALLGEGNLTQLMTETREDVQLLSDFCNNLATSTIA